MQQKNIAVSIVLSIVTCGIYAIYWFITLTNDVNTLKNDSEATSGGKAFLFSIITCGIYGLYWAYKQGVKLDEIKKSRGLETGNNAVLYLILSIFGLGIVGYALMQNEINKLIEA